MPHAPTPLDEANLAADPVAQFSLWFNAALALDRNNNAMTLATANAQGRPSARIVLLKSFDAEGFVFFTNYESRKGRELTDNPFASLVFFWPALLRQVRVEGAVQRLSAEASTAYFHSRPHGSQLGAWASRQSQPLPARHVLEREVAALAARYHEGDVPRPPHWGGFCVVPERFEFWQERPDRLHDRFAFTRQASGFRRERLYP